LADLEYQSEKDVPMNWHEELKKKEKPEDVND
jgi:hypothetical protein